MAYSNIEYTICYDSNNVVGIDQLNKTGWATKALTQLL